MNVKIDSAIKLIDKVFAKHKMDIVLAYEESKHGPVVITALVCNEKNSEMPPGTVEYSLCDGLPGKRSESFDFFDLDEALKAFNKVVKNGWNAWLNRK